MDETTPPPVIVQLSEYPVHALAAFIAQELGVWKFNVRHGAEPGTLVVYPPGRELGVTLTVKVEVRGGAAVRENDKC